LPEEFLPAAKRFIDEMPAYMEEYEGLLAQNEIILARAIGVGAISQELAINASIRGPVLRSTGVQWDWRKMDPYSIYDRFEFDIPTGVNGDNYDRYRVRIKEIWQSLKILKQAIEQMPEKGETIAKLPHFLRPPQGEAYGHIESPQGELGFYIVSDNSIAPYRLHIRPPTLINVTALRDMVIGWKVADVIATFGSIDVCLGEIDR
jgi:NADH-quinone oxidoreductase subunit D